MSEAAFVTPTPPQVHVGSTVEYHPTGSDNVVHYQGQPLFAVVAYVWSQTLVNLAVLDAAGVWHALSSVRFVGVDEPEPAPTDGRYATFQARTREWWRRVQQMLAASVPPEPAEAASDAPADSDQPSPAEPVSDPSPPSEPQPATA